MLCHQPPVWLSQPILLPGPRYSHPLKLRIRCCSSRSGLCITQRHKAGKQTSYIRAPRSTAASATQSPWAENNREQDCDTNSERSVPGLGSRRSAAASSASRTVLPQTQADPPLPALLGPVGIRRRPLTWSPCNLQPGGCGGRAGGGQRWVQRARTVWRGRVFYASSAEARSAERGGDGAGAEEGFPSSLLLPTSSRAGSSPKGGAWQGTALLCVPVLSAGHCGGGPHSGGSGAGRFIQDINFSGHWYGKAEQTIGHILRDIIKFLWRAQISIQLEECTWSIAKGKIKTRNYLVCFHFYNKISPVHICIMVGEGKDTSVCDNTVLP